MNDGFRNRDAAQIGGSAKGSQYISAGPFDLVSAQYFHTPIDIPRERALRSAAASVAPQGVLLIVDHASTAAWSWNQDPHARFPTPQDTVDQLELDGHWQPIRIEDARRTATGPGGQTGTVIDNVIALRRVVDPDAPHPKPVRTTTERKSSR